MWKPRGRPTKHQEKAAGVKYNDDMPGHLLEVLRDGYTLDEFCVINNISKKTFYDYCDKYPEMKEAYSVAKLAFKVEKVNWLKSNLTNKDMNARLVEKYLQHTLEHTDYEDDIARAARPDEELPEIKAAREAYSEATKSEF